MASEKERLLERLRAGDGEAQRELFLLYRAEVLATCRRILVDAVVAEDVAEDVMIDFLFEAIHRIQRAETMRSYLHLMAARRSLKRREQGARAANTSTDLLPTSSPSPASTAELQQALQQLDACLTVLSPKARQALRLRFGRGLSQEQIGSLLGGSKQYIGRLLKQSFRKLRVCMSSAGFQVSDGDLG